jgi:hypothetical protein
LNIKFYGIINTPEVKAFIRKHSSLFWYIPEDKKEDISLDVLVEVILNWGSKWKDYVDFYFLLRDYFTIDQISVRASEIYDQQFSPKFFRVQISYFDDIIDSEPVEYLVSAPSEEEIRQFLIDKAIDFVF